jgi:hypothetical protein
MASVVILHDLFCIILCCGDNGQVIRVESYVAIGIPNFGVEIDLRHGKI